MNIFLYFILSNFAIVLSVKPDTLKEILADRICFNKALLNAGLLDQVHRNKDNKFLFKSSCRKFRREEKMNPVEAAKKVIELYTQGLGVDEKIVDYDYLN